MKIYATKYALTAGIKENDAEIDAEIDGSMATVRPTGSVWMTSYFHGNDWHLTEEAASKRAEEMRIAKIASLQKQIAKLKAMKF